MIFPTFHEESLSLHELAEPVTHTCALPRASKEEVLSAYQEFCNNMKEQIRKAMLFDNVGNVLNIIASSKEGYKPYYNVVPERISISQYKEYLLGMNSYFVKASDLAILPAEKVHDVIEKDNVFVTKLIMGSDDMIPTKQMTFDEARDVLFFVVNRLICQDVVPGEFLIDAVPDSIIALPVLSIVRMYDLLSTYAIYLLLQLTKETDTQEVAPTRQIF